MTTCETLALFNNGFRYCNRGPRIAEFTHSGVFAGGFFTETVTFFRVERSSSRIASH